MSRDIRFSFVQPLAKAIKFPIFEFGIEAEHAQIGIVLRKFNAVADKFCFEFLVAHDEHRRAGINAVNVFARYFARSINFVAGDIEPHFMKFFDVVFRGFAAVIREKANALAKFFQRAYRVETARDFLIADIDRAVHIEQKQFNVQKFFRERHIR